MITILQGGCDTRHPSTFLMSRKEGLNNYLLLIVRSQGSFAINQIPYQLEPGYAIIFSPKTPYSYENPKGDYVNDWLHFQFQSEHDIPPNLPKVNEPFPIGNHRPYTTLIQQMLTEVYHPSPYANENISSLFGVLVNHLAIAYESKDTAKERNLYQEELQDLRMEINRTITINHSIQEAAKSLGLSESYFQHLYKDYFNISFQQDFIQMRVDYAKYILRTTDVPIEQISDMCGYLNEVHFYRQFKKITGTTPAKYRKHAIDKER